MPALDRIAPGVARVARRDANGWTVDMLLVDLDDGVLVYSPTWIGDATASLVEELGAPRVLVAPNHYHHLSLPKYQARWPDAVSVAAARALPRLGKQGRVVESLDRARLSPRVRLVEVEGAKNGECWAIVEHEGGDKTLLVCDAFFNVEEPVRGFMGFALRALRTAPGLSLGRTLVWLGIGDRARYKRFVVDLLEREKPSTIAFSHGAPLRAVDAWQRCAELVERHV